MRPSAALASRGRTSSHEHAKCSGAAAWGVRPPSSVRRERPASALAEGQPAAPQPRPRAVSAEAEVERGGSGWGDPNAKRVSAWQPDVVIEVGVGSNPPRQPGRQPNLNALPDRRADEHDESAGMRYILTELPGGYRPVGVDEIIRVAHDAGGLAVLAHPGRSKGVYAIPATAEDIAQLAGLGLDGIELFYPTHTDAQRAFYQELAQRHGLLVTGGSDSHSPHEELARVDPGDLRITPGVPTILERILT